MFVLIPLVLTNGGVCRDSKKKLTISYPCVMLNVDIARNNTNNQYQVSIEQL